MNFNENFCECGDKCYILSSFYWVENPNRMNCKYRFYKIHDGNIAFQYKNFDSKNSIIIKNNTRKVYFIKNNNSTELGVRFNGQYEDINELVKFCNSILDNVIFM